MLKTVLESLDGLDEAVSKLYTETDGKFILQIEGVDSHPDVANLKSAYERVKADKTKATEERDALQAKVKEFPDDFDPERWSKLKEGKADEAALIKLRQELEAKVADAEKRASDAESKVFKTAIERDLTDELSGVGITEPKFLQSARRDISDKVKIGDEGKAIVESDMGPISLGEFVKRYAAGEGKAFVTSASGGDRKGKDNQSTGDKKWSEMTSGEKTRLHQQDPEAYKRIKEAAA